MFKFDFGIMIFHSLTYVTLIKIEALSLILDILMTISILMLTLFMRKAVNKKKLFKEEFF